MSLVKKERSMPTRTTQWNDFFDTDFFDWTDKNYSTMGSTFPSANVKETENEFNIELAAPGLNKEDFTVELQDHMLTICSEKKQEKEEMGKDGKYTRKEFSYQSFQRSFRLPDSVDEDKVNAEYKNGILNIQVGKKYVDTHNSGKRISVS